MMSSGTVLTPSWPRLTPLSSLVPFQTPQFPHSSLNHLCTGHSISLELYLPFPTHLPKVLLVLSKISVDITSSRKPSPPPPPPRAPCASQFVTGHSACQLTLSAQAHRRLAGRSAEGSLDQESGPFAPASPASLPAPLPPLCSALKSPVSHLLALGPAGLHRAAPGRSCLQPSLTGRPWASPQPLCASVSTGG